MAIYGNKAIYGKMAIFGNQAIYRKIGPIFKNGNICKKWLMKNIDKNCVDGLNIIAKTKKLKRG